ncbi:MAG: AAA family ATPase [Candidatus Omnitrophica bacterium]|nr:AAA family ATPase [Candidatus Omnitrophota bacterium]
MGYIIAVAGKGGTGKTTITALIVRLIKESGSGSILAIDADPNSNLAENLGLKPKDTIGKILDRVASNLDKIPAGMSKDRFIEYEVQTSIVEAPGFDVLTMGRPEGPGCYCYVNNVLRGIIDKLVKEYDYVVIDNEAGLEHLSRRTTRHADVLIVISDATKVGLRSAKRINELAEELKIQIKKKLLIINRYNGALRPEGRGPLRLFGAIPRSGKIECLRLPREHTALSSSASKRGFSAKGDKEPDKQAVKAIGIEYIGSIPEDNSIIKLSLEGNSLLGLKNDTTSLNALRKMGDKIWQRS